MSNKTQLQTNNTNLDALIARVNAAKDVAASLPEAGGGSGGGSVEVVTGTITASSPFGVSGAVYYLDENMSVQQKDTEGTISVVKNSIVFVLNGGDGVNLAGNYTLLESTIDGKLFYVTGNFSVSC